MFSFCLFLSLVFLSLLLTLINMLFNSLVILFLSLSVNKFPNRDATFLILLISSFISLSSLLLSKVEVSSLIYLSSLGFCDLKREQIKSSFDILSKLLTWCNSLKSIKILNDNSFNFLTRSNSFNDMYLFDNLFKFKWLSSFLIRKSVRRFNNEFIDNLWGF